MSWLFDPAGLTPHGFCLLWEPGLIWTYALSDFGIGLAYFTIPVALAVFLHRRKDLALRPIFWLFAIFILLCGTTHFLDVVTLWEPAYGIEALVKAMTAVVSLGTAVMLWLLLPQALAIPSSAQLQAAHAALRESEARYRATFEHSPVPMQVLDENKAITLVSRSWLSLLGYDCADVIGHRLSEFYAAGVGPWSASDWTRLMEDGEVSNLERRCVRRDGSVVDVLLSARLEHHGNALSVVSAIIDITDRRRAEAALRASEERLHQSQKMEAVGQLTGGIAHDFNNMLQSVSGCLDLIDRSVGRGKVDAIARYVATARKAVDRAAGLTNRMLAFARRQALQPRAVEPDKLIDGIAELIRRSVGPEVHLDMRLGDGRWSVLCDPNQLENVLLNVALNAGDAMPDGGTLTIATADRTLTQADLFDQDECTPGCYVEIKVADTGTGMTPDVLARAFEPFFTTKPTGQGTGLGLSQVFGFVRQSGGFVRLESKVGNGSAVRIYLPRFQASQSDPDEMARNVAGTADDHSAGQVVGAPVLVVEDEADVRDLIASVLRDLGCSVLEAQDGPAGLRVVQSQARLDLLITDVGLPGLNGRQLADAARSMRQGLPVLFITGYAGRALEDAELAPRMEVLRKPFGLEELSGRVRALLNGTNRW